jgi:hypothetical protein
MEDIKKIKETKGILASKTFWTFIVTIIILFLQQQGVPIPAWIIEALLAAGLLFSRLGKKRIKI